MSTAVVTSTELIRVHDGTHIPLMATPSRVDALAALMSQYNITSAWLAVEGPSLADQPGFWTPTTSAVNIYPNEASPMKAVVRGRPNRYIHDARDGMWTWTDMDVTRMVEEIRAAELALEVQIVMSPAGTGATLLQADLISRGWWEPEALTYPDRPHIWAQPLVFTRQAPRSDYEHIHVLDRNAAYMQAAASSDFGIGAHFEAPDRELGPRNEFACWLVTTDGGSEWMMTPAVRMLTPGEYSIEGCLRWPNSRRLLRPWADRLWMAREVTDGPARAMIKIIGNATVGLFAHPRENGTRAWHYRPEWRAQIVSTNALTLDKRITELEQRGHFVLWAYDDAIAVASNTSQASALLGSDSPWIGAGRGRYRATHQITGSGVKKLINAAAELSPLRWQAEMLRIARERPVPPTVSAASGKA